jgi:hypothetical protein
LLSVKKEKEKKKKKKRSITPLPTLSSHGGRKKNTKQAWPHLSKGARVHHPWP